MQDIEAKREAARIRMARWRAKQPPLTAEERQEEREAKRIYNAVYYEQHGEEMRTKQRERNAKSYALNPDKQQLANKSWAERHPEKGAERQALRRARRKAAPVSEKVDRLVVAERDGWICKLCNESIDLNALLRDPVTNQYNPWYLHIDHIMPLSKGGDHSYANSQASHAICNKRKSAKILVDQDIVCSRG